MKLLDRACPICKSMDHEKTRYHKDHWEIVKCNSCDMVFLRNAPVYETLVSDFEWSESLAEERRRRREKRKLYYFFSDNLKKLKGYIRGKQRKEITLLEKLNKSGRLLDVGCANGGTLKSVPKGYTPFGVEISPALASQANEYCKERGGKVVAADSISGISQFSDDFFDVILMRSYLEHEIQPLEVLQQARRKLKDDGLIIIKVPNYGSVNRRIRGVGWPGFRFPDHVNYFTPDTLKKIIKESGLNIRKFNFIDHIATSDNMWLFAEK